MNYCASKGGFLFGEIDGTVEQLQQMQEKLEEHAVFLGVRPDQDFVVFHNTNGEDVSDLILWAEGQPHKAPADQCVLINPFDGLVHDNNCGLSRTFACVLPV